MSQGLGRAAQMRFGVAVGLTSLLVYISTLAPDVVFGDGGEFQFAAWTFSFVHPTGYPLYLILGGIFQHLLSFTSTPAYWLNFFTALSAVGAVVLLYLILRAMGVAHGAAFLAALSLAVARQFWYDALAAEVYALHAFFVALLLLLALRWQAAPDADKAVWFCFAFGLALTHHRAIVLWIPALACFFLLVVWGRGFRVSGFQGFSVHISRFALYFIAPLLLYLYIPLRAPTSPYAILVIAPNNLLVLYDNTLNGLLNYVLGRTFASELAWNAASIARLAAFPQLLLDQFGAIGVALGAVGFAAMLWRKEWARFALLFIGALANLLFASIYHIGDIASYYVPVYLVWAVWIGVGLATVVSSFKLQVSSRRMTVGLLAALLILPIYQLAINLPYADRSNETNARGSWLRYLDTLVPRGAILISNDRDEMMPLWYLQYVEQRRRDVVGLFPLITPAPEHANVGRLIDSVFQPNRAVYLVKPMPGIETKFWLGQEGKLTRVMGRTRETPPAHASDAVIADRIAVKGYDAIRQENVLRVAVFWQTRTKLDENYTAFVHLLDASGNKITQGNDHQVGGEYYPSRLWDAGEVLRDEHGMFLPDGIAPGTYRLVVGMYRSSDRELLGEPVEIGRVEVKR